MDILEQTINKSTILNKHYSPNMIVQIEMPCIQYR